MEIWILVAIIQIANYMIFSRILILGATGRTGSHLLQQALEAGYEVNVLVRDSNKLTLKHKKLRIFEGTPTDVNALTAAMEGCDAILSTLNISRKSDFPWSAIVTPADFLSQTATNIVKLAPVLNIARVIALSAVGVGETRNDIPVWFRWLVDHSNIGVTYKDHERQEKIFAQSDLKFTILRPVGLTNSNKVSEVRVSFNNEPKPSLTISRQDVARFILKELAKDLYVYKMPVIFS